MLTATFRKPGSGIEINKKISSDTGIKDRDFRINIF